MVKKIGIKNFKVRVYYIYFLVKNRKDRKICISENLFLLLYDLQN